MDSSCSSSANLSWIIDLQKMNIVSLETDQYFLHTDVLIKSNSHHMIYVTVSLFSGAALKTDQMLTSFTIHARLHARLHVALSPWLH